MSEPFYPQHATRPVDELDEVLHGQERLERLSESPRYATSPPTESMEACLERLGFKRPHPRDQGFRSDGQFSTQQDKGEGSCERVAQQ